MILLVLTFLSGLLIGFGVRFVGTWRQDARLMDLAPFIGFGTILLIGFSALMLDSVFELKGHYPVWLQLATPFLAGTALAVGIGAFFVLKFIIVRIGAGIDYLGEAARVRWDDFRARNGGGQEAE